MAQRVCVIVSAAEREEPSHEATTGGGDGQNHRHLVGLVQRIWQAHKLQPHRLRTFKRSRDPALPTS